MRGKTMFLRTIAFTFAAAAMLMAASPKVTEAQAKVKAGKFEEALAILDPAYKASPKDAEITKALAETHLKYGDSFMYNEALPPRQKYRPALKQYREVLTFDPKNKDAQDKIKLIEGIYKQMGMPIPQ
jgi:tetratricopeptide (TPR) repeat protein